MKLMNNYIVSCPAKINLFLNITGKKENLHTLKLVNQSISLYDYLEIEIIKEDVIILQSSNKSIPLDDNNSIYKAFILMKKMFKINDGFKVNIIKNIPIESGLGGESTDAAGIIMFINKIYKLNLKKEKLYEIGRMIGSDVPFCIHGGSVFIDEQNNMHNYKIDNYYYLIVKPKFGLSTKFMYDKYDELIYEFKLNDIVLGYNDFEKVVGSDVIKIKNKLLGQGAVFSNLSGSGSAVIGAFIQDDDQKNAYNSLKYIYEVYMVNVCNGIVIKKDQ